METLAVEIPPSGFHSLPSAPRLKIKKNGYKTHCEEIINGKDESILSSRLPQLTPISVALVLKWITGGDPPVMVDVRESRLYQTGHIKGARSANCYTKTMAKRACTTWSNWFPSCRSGKTVVLYDQKSEAPCKTAPLMSYISHLSDLGNTVYFLQGGFDAFKKMIGGNHPAMIDTCLPQETIQQYTCSPTSLDNGSEDVLNATASEIMSFLYLGNERDAHDLELLESKGITHILNVSTNVSFHFETMGKFKYRRLSASDCHVQDLRQFFDQAFAFIDEARNSNGRVLVHCWAGVSRSPTIVMAYIMKHSELGVLNALEFVRSKRSIVGPNINFMGQLERYHCDLDLGREARTNSLENELEGVFDHKKLTLVSSLSSSSGSGEDTPGPYSLPCRLGQQPFLK